MRETARHEFETQTLPFQKALYQSARSMLANEAAAQDAVLETYLQAWRSWEKFEIGTNCRAWMFRILLNVVRHERRKWSWRFRFWETSEAFENTLVADAPQTEQLVDSEILAALKAIPQQYSEVVMLADVQEFSYKEIQDLLNIPIGTVMSRLSRGRGLLRTKLAHRAAEFGIGAGVQSGMAGHL